MTDLIQTLRHHAEQTDLRLGESASLSETLMTYLETSSFAGLLDALIAAPAFTQEMGEMFARADAVEAVSPCRMLRGALNLPLVQVFSCLSRIYDALNVSDADKWRGFSDALARDKSLASIKLLHMLTRDLPDPELRRQYKYLAERLTRDHPHAIYPTSAYRACDGHVQTSADERTVEAVMSVSTFSSIRVVDNVLDPADETLRDIYLPLQRCVCFVDSNVEASYGERLIRYFQTHDIALKKHVYRAMEVDKGIATVERMLGDLKQVKVGRHEPVLVMGGGVLADTAGLACALYGRNTPYVMLSTSIVSGIDAGPSPRTCCDGFGYKNLVGAYHPPVVSLTDRHFFGTLREGWVRHGVAEIIKMAVVKNLSLFEDLERGMSRLVSTKFGTVGCDAEDPIHDLSQDILAGALKSYIEAEYDNLYETHQCRPHAYGHTWSPGFEIEAGLLHGHAVSIGMGFGAYVSLRQGWITEADFKRIMALISGYGLSLWSNVMHDKAVMIESHRKMIQKRGGNLVAPLPRGGIGQCGYLDMLAEDELIALISDYHDICQGYARKGRGIEPLCTDVGLENPSAQGALPIRDLTAA